MIHEALERRPDLLARRKALHISYFVLCLRPPESFCKSIAGHLTNNPGKFQVSGKQLGDASTCGTMELCDRRLARATTVLFMLHTRYAYQIGTEPSVWTLGTARTPVLYGHGPALVWSTWSITHFGNEAPPACWCGVEFIHRVVEKPS